MNLPRVRVLPMHVANRIAAGEVVERPASVVKELVENAIDAGATQVDVVVERAGSRLIEVVDNGGGMLPEDVALAVQRHATSKIHEDTDLAAISTLGFRGEALPSIASVSRMESASRPRGARSGRMLRLEGGQVLEERDAGMPEGSRVSIRDLFYNTPARQKFLKEPATETRQMVRTLTRLALSRPDVGFRLVSDGADLFRTPAGTPVAERVAAVLGVDMRHFAAVSFINPAVRISGFASRPSLSKTARDGQHFLVNGRCVSNVSLSHALLQAYQGALPSGRHPVCVVYLEMDAREVDVNVHPTKAEVRFTKSREVHDYLVGAVRHALRIAGTPLAAAPSGTDHAAAERSQAPLDRPELFADEPPGRPGESLAAADGARVAAARLPELPAAWRTPPVGGASCAPSAQSFPAEQQPHQGQGPAAGAGVVLPQAAQAQGRRSRFGILGQVLHSYIVADMDGHLVVIDQHAAHERILYEKLSRACGGDQHSQDLLMPIVVDLAPEDMAACRECAQVLASLGWEVAEFGAGKVAIQGVPPGMERAPYAQAFLEILSAVSGQGGRNPQAAARETALCLMACHGAVKAGDALTMLEMEALVADLKKIPHTSTCPHGRPLWLQWGPEDLARLFKRT